MAFLFFDHEITDGAFAGNKAARLAELKSAGFRIPSFFVIGAHAAHEICRTTLRSETAGAIQTLCRNGQRVAVRSSSIEEDGSENSFAGQFASFLDIAPQDVVDYAYKVWDSAGSEQVAAYREANGVTGAVPRPAVLVQKMVEADAAGVAFAVDPVDGDRDHAVVAAVRGVGESLVSGECQGDTWHVNRRGKLTGRKLEADEPVLTDRQVRKIAKLVRAVSAHYGTPQDIEWAIGNGSLFLLQSRDITSLPASGSMSDYGLWDNSNIVESYGGVTTPLTFSVARSAYQEAYRHFGRVLGVSEREITRHESAYEQMIGLIQGRVYYNLLNWYRLLMLTPGFRYNRKFMEQMMGVTEGLPRHALPSSEGRFASIRAGAGLSRVACRLLTKLFRHNAKVANFHDRLDAALQKVDFESYSLAALLDYYEALENQVIPAWDTPLINDLYCMIFHGMLRALCERWLDEDLAGAHNELVRGDADIISLEPVRRMQRMAAIAAKDPRLATALREASSDNALRAIRSSNALGQQFDAYLERFGDRCLDELKLESRTLSDDPEPLLRAIGQLAAKRNSGEQLSQEVNSQRVTEERVNACLAGSPVRRLVFAAVLKLARGRVRDRENLRFERTRVYGRVRSIFVEIGERLTALGVLESSDGIFYLSVEEIGGLVRGTGCTTRVSDLVKCRQREFAEYADNDAPSRRFITRGPAQLPSSIQPAPAAAEQSNPRNRQGQGCSPGVVRGRVRIVRDPKAAKVCAGDILVAERTDPGWVMIFPLVSGMIMERGSLLSHSAIVARELHIPAVVGVDDACSWLEDGDWVELDGASGSIRKLAPQEQAA